MARPTLLFFRAYHAFQGGHLKLAHYMAHANAVGPYAPRLYLAPGSHADHPFPRDIITNHWRPDQADALFLAGMDWAHVPPGLEERLPVINLIQHTRHALPDDPRHAFLSRQATRICVSEEVAQKLRASGQVNGPVHTLPAGLDVDCLPPESPKHGDVLICGLKQPALALALAKVLQDQGVRARLLTEAIPRGDFLAALKAARIAITLPDAAEGFYLPALEAMAAGCAVICPDAVGNRGFCRDRDTCLMPAPTPQALSAAVQRLLSDPLLALRLTRGGRAEARRHSLDAERAAFLRVMEQVHQGVRVSAASAGA